MEWETAEQRFTHQRVMLEAKKLSKDELLKIFDSVYRQQQMHNRLFTCLVKWCVSNAVELPAFDQLLAPKIVDHPAEQK
jgi:hypothetical protein